MSDLVEFLRARLDEDLAALPSVPYFVTIGSDGTTTQGDAVPPGLWGPSRIQAEIAAKRRIVDLHRPDPTDDGSVECCFCSFHEQYEGFNDVSEEWPCEHLRLLALPFADHPDYDESWRP